MYFEKKYSLFWSAFPMTANFQVPLLISLAVINEGHKYKSTWCITSTGT